MAPILYKMDASPPARAVLMLADILGIRLDTRDLNPVLREQDTPELTKKNPMRTIPLLQDGEFHLADSHAIMIYLFNKYGKPEHKYLYPDDVKLRATINQRLFFDCGILFQRLRSVMAPVYAGRLTELSKSMHRNIDDAYRMMETYLSETSHLADNVVTLADISAMSTLSSLEGLHSIDGSRFPKLRRWYENMSQQSYCKRLNEPGALQHVQGLKMFMENNKSTQKNKSKL